MKKFDLAMAVLGLATFAVVATKAGPAIVRMELKHLWMGVAFVILLSLARLTLQTCSWSTALRTAGHRSSLFELMGIRLAAQCLGYLSTLGPVLSEPLKIRLLGTSPFSAVSTLIDTGVF